MKEMLLLFVMFWNVENFFDTYDNPSTNDETFTPAGENHWNWKRFEKKRDDIAKTILLATDECGEMPVLVGLCEIENSFVLEELTENTPLARAGYSFLHKDSPDSRGIDVALLYRKDLFTPLEEHYIASSFPTREILYTKGVLNGLDTIHVFVNHWPSKRGGGKSSSAKRKLVSHKARQVTDSILQKNPSANIIHMGDFNDTWESEPLENLDQLVNLSRWAEGNEGSYKYRESWSTIDQFLVSENLIRKEVPETDTFSNQWIWCEKKMKIFAPIHLLCEDEKYLGIKLRRTYSGPRYLGGTSDHLPILLELHMEE